MQLPKLIQGGMGVAISDWRLAKAVSQLGQLGVVSGTGISRVLASRLMDGDLSGHVRRALENFALPEPVQAIINRYYTPGGKTPETPYKTPGAYSIRPAKFLDQITAIANYVEVYLAKEGHSGVVGINLLEKVQMPNLASLYGAMLAGVDVVLMGAGSPSQVAGILDKVSNHEPVSYRVDVHGADKEDDHRIHFDPESVFPGISKLVGKLKRPKFLPIISSVVLAQALIKRSEGPVDGFVIEGPTAGGHNAPPRGTVNFNEKGEPIYGDKDVVDLEKMKLLGLPFWLAGGYGNPKQVQAALDAGAAGVQVGTAFSLCDESGMRDDLKKRMLQKVRAEEAEVFTSPLASPTGFPFKVAKLEGTLSDPKAYGERPRVCDLGFLRILYKKENGTVGYRCASEPVDDFVKKGGAIEDTVNRSCLCNNLTATAGFPQIRKDGYVEQPIITSGDDLVSAAQFIKEGKTSYSAEDVIRYLLGPLFQQGTVSTM
ncbi:MAG: nitronate monooxygenase [Anaerolineales bacterium]|uniref:nitronate monooxygenase n=1 Tax=Candidatus Villigracilis proximus TaxID=3140683 RepID=UPI0031370DC0|nr:nitronate monooxygenase [Anaerolineales bacterium]